MRIIIETDDSGKVALKSQGQVEAGQQTQQLDYQDGGAPNEELLTALGESASEGDELEYEEEESIAEDIDESIIH